MVALCPEAGREISWRCRVCEDAMNRSMLVRPSSSDKIASTGVWCISSGRLSSGTRTMLLSTPLSGTTRITKIVSSGSGERSPNGHQDRVQCCCPHVTDRTSSTLSGRMYVWLFGPIVPIAQRASLGVFRIAVVSEQHIAGSTSTTSSNQLSSKYLRIDLLCRLS